MKKTAKFLILTFSFYLIGQLFWWLSISYQEPLWGNKYLEEMSLMIIYTLSGIFGLLSGITLYKSKK